jgi:excisionase family DNA binding protein
MSLYALTIEQLAERLACSAKTIRRRVKEGTFPIPCLPALSRAYRWSSTDVDRFLAEGATHKDRYTRALRRVG